MVQIDWLNQIAKWFTPLSKEGYNNLQPRYKSTNQQFTRVLSPTIVLPTK